MFIGQTVLFPIDGESALASTDGNRLLMVGIATISLNRNGYLPDQSVGLDFKLGGFEVRAEQAGVGTFSKGVEGLSKAPRLLFVNDN